MLSIIHINLWLAWLWIVLGFIAGFILGVFFHKDEWLGGYAGFKRRLYRLAHISFFGTALLNLMFYFSIRDLAASTSLRIASWGFVVGAVSMPVCCLVVAYSRKLRSVFMIPVITLSVAGFITLVAVSGL